MPDAIYTYDAADAVATVSYPKVVAGSVPPLTPPVTTYTYNELGSLMRSVTVNNTDVQFEQRLQYNEGGQILREWSSLMDEERSQYFAYDDVSRLISNNVGGNNTFFEYDHVGNRLETNRLGTYHYTYDAPVGQPRTNRLTSVWTTTNTWDELDYDPDGAVQHRERRYVIKDANNVFDITRHHVLEDFSYDAFNLIEVYKRRRDVASATGGETCTADATLVPYDEWRYRFGPLQEREQKRQYANANGTLNSGLLWTYTLLGADAKQLMTYNGLQADWCGQPAGTVWIWPVEHNSYGPAQSRIIMRPDGTRNVVITDHLGSTRLTLSTDAAPMQSQLHNAFGEVTSDAGEGARTGYIGREHDVESDLGFYGVRLYEPEYGRFMSTDPLWGMYITLQPYQYAGNNPVSLLDYSGREIDLSNLNNSISHGGEVSEVASEVKSGVIGDLTDITGLPLADNGQGKLVVAHGPVMGGSQTARELLTTAIESTETVYLSLGNIKKASQGGEFGGHSVVGINPFQVRDVINGARGGLDSRTMGFGMTFLHELSHTRLGGSLTDATSPGNPEGDVEKRMNVVRTELGASWGQRQTYVAVQDGNYYEIPFSKAGMLLNEAGKPPIGPSVRFTKTGWE